MTLDIDTIRRLIEHATRVVASADDTGCSDDLTVVSREAISDLANALRDISE